jgi:hypothetical protein
MPNHFHFIVKVKAVNTILKATKKEQSKVNIAFQKGEKTLNDFVIDQYRRFMSSYALAYNFRNHNAGQLFLKRFKRVGLDSEDRLPYMICYVHHNPIHHGFTTDFESWKYSSFSRKEISNIFIDEGEYLDHHKTFMVDQKEKMNIDK